MSVDSGGRAAAIGSSGMLSGDAVQIPISIQINARGDIVDVSGLPDTDFGSARVNTGWHARV
ncbi:chaplin family protein [Streptomyces sp. NPDC001595]|uniref:chaplin family protein n=1 Tax=Streptomyces sp. NPDC001532 TaxID=3154520 RepID=UPI003323AFBC